MPSDLSAVRHQVGRGPALVLSDLSAVRSQVGLHAVQVSNEATLGRLLWQTRKC